MDKPPEASHRQTLLVAAVAAGLAAAAVVLLQPDLKLASFGISTAAGEDDASLLDADDSDDILFTPLERPLRRQSAASVSRELSPVDAPANEALNIAGVPGPRPFVRQKPETANASGPATGRERVTPPPWSERLARFQDEREVLELKARSRGATVAAASSAPAAPSDVIVTSGEESPAGDRVVHALAQASDAASFRRVQPVRHRLLPDSTAASAAGRGAWLAGTIEID
ncbi:MAG: hypothetical protein KF774_14670 [Planctomyces sp.]|nr:hypothetical protein [Planctomyces sp.]